VTDGRRFRTPSPPENLLNVLAFLSGDAVNPESARVPGMNKFTGFAALLPVAASLASGCSDDYVFRNDERPVFDNTVSIAEFQALQAQGATVIDVRLIEDFDAEPVLIPDAMRRDPEEIQSWAASMSPTEQPVIVYCVAGKWVSQKAANYLKDQGFEVYSLEGGIEAWQSADMPTNPANP
jgi:rhodanese-related sulfurtransferase